MSGYNATIHRYPLGVTAQQASLQYTPHPAVIRHISSISRRFGLRGFPMPNPLCINTIPLLGLLFLLPVLFPSPLHLRDTPFVPGTFLDLLLHPLELCALRHVFNPMLRALAGALNLKVHDCACRLTFSPSTVLTQLGATSLADGIEDWDGREASAAVTGELQTTHSY